MKYHAMFSKLGSRMITERKNEKYIRNVLKSLSRQRVAIYFPPTNTIVVERAPKDSEGLQEALRTCHLRGWVEPIANAIPHGKLTSDNQLPERFDSIQTVYRLTGAGWAVVNRSQFWVIATFIIVSVTLIATLIGILVAYFGWNC
jgi:hypothetical protein